MTVNAAERLRIGAEHLPPGSSIMVGREELLKALGTRDTTGRDWTVSEVGERLSRSPSTVRSWLQEGVLHGYRFRGRQWRVTASAIAEFEGRERAGESRRTAKGDAVDLGAWRKETA